MKAALFIDTNTIDSRYINLIYKEAVHMGDIIFKRAYGIAAQNEKLKNELLDDAIYIEDADSKYQDRIPMKMAVDMIKAADDSAVDFIMAATQDAYIAPVLSLIREKGKKVILFGSCRKRGPLRHECSNYIYIEALNGEPITEYITPIADIVKTVRDIISSYKGRGEEITVDKLYRALCRMYKDFDARNYGYTHFELFVKNEVEGVYIAYENNRAYVNIAEGNEKIERFIYSYLAQNNNQIDDMNQLFDALIHAFPGFSTSHYGYNSDYAFLLSFPKLQLCDNKGVKLKQTFKLK